MQIKFASEDKLRAQMAGRGWTDERIVEALQTPGIAMREQFGPAPDMFIRGQADRSLSMMRPGKFNVGGDGLQYDD